MTRSVMRFIAYVVAVLLSTVSVSPASIYYVSTSGSGSNPGDSWETGHAKSLAWVNENITAGDVAYLQGGTYSDPIQPQESGTQGSPIAYLGNESNPLSVVVASVIFGPGNTWTVAQYGSWCSVKWVTTGGGIIQETSLGPYDPNLGYNPPFQPTGDSLIRCRVTGGAFVFHGTHSVLDWATVTLTNAPLDMEGQFTNPGCTNLPVLTAPVEGQVVRNSIFSLSFNGSDAEDLSCILLKAANNCAIYNNSIAITVSTTNATNHYVVGIYLWAVNRLVFNDNDFTFTDNSLAEGTKAVWNLRDYTRWCQFFRNAVSCSGNAKTAIFAANSGTYGACGGGPAYNRFEGNTFGVANPGDGLGGPAAAVQWEGGVRGDTVRFNRFLTSAATKVVEMTQCDSLIFAHNQCWNAGGTVADLGYGSADGSVSLISGNTFYGTEANSGGTPTLTVCQQCVVDSLGLAFNIGAGSDSAYAIRPHGGAVNPPQALGITGSAAWFTPEVADSSSFASDPALLPESHAISTKMSGGYAGPTRQTNPPDAIADIAGVSRNVAVVPAIAEIAFDVPIAIAAYEARIIPLTEEPTSENYDADGAPVAMPTPGSAGSSQTVTVNVPADKNYWLMIKTVNGYGHKSAIAVIGVGHTEGTPWFVPPIE